MIGNHPCCKEHINAGDPNGCRRRPMDQITIARKAREKQMFKDLERRVAESIFRRDGMLLENLQ